MSKKTLDTSFHSRLMAAQMGDPEFREEYERAGAEIALVDSVIRQLDALREEEGLSKAELARRIDRNASSIRRLFSAASNPELLLVASIAVELDAEIKIVPRKTNRKKASSPKPKRHQLAVA
jgi:ribosome-binding protein aMBF1 (putative translation factor)